MRRHHHHRSKLINPDPPATLSFGASSLFPVALLKNPDCLIRGVASFFSEVSLLERDILELHCFTQKAPPEITLQEYLMRITNYMSLEPTALLSGIIYYTKISRHHASFHLDARSVHRFLITSIALASKALGDCFYSNLYAAKVGGIEAVDLSKMELHLAELLDWRAQLSLSEILSAWDVLQAKFMNSPLGQ